MIICNIILLNYDMVISVILMMPKSYGHHTEGHCTMFENIFIIQQDYGMKIESNLLANRTKISIAVESFPAQERRASSRWSCM